MTPEDIHQQIRAACASTEQVIVLLAGSNGAGKTTYYERYLADTGLPFVNADEIARQIGAIAATPELSFAREAMHRAEARRQLFVASGQAFIMETVLSDPHGAKLKFLEDARASGYVLIVIFIRLDEALTSAVRVMQRVSQGGHAVPEDKIFARFPRTATNARRALELATFGYILDNSNVDEPYRWVETWREGICVDPETGFRAFEKRGGIVTNASIDAIRDDEQI